MREEEETEEEEKKGDLLHHAQPIFPVVLLEAALQRQSIGLFLGDEMALLLEKHLGELQVLGCEQLVRLLHLHTHFHFEIRNGMRKEDGEEETCSTFSRRR